MGVNVGRPNVNNGDGDELFPNYFGEDLLALKWDVLIREIHNENSQMIQG